MIKNGSTSSVATSKALALLLFILASFSLSAQQIDSLKIGSGGGFTGQSTVYRIHKKEVKKGSGLLSVQYTSTAKLTCAQKKTIKQSAQTLLKETPFEHPSNTYRWVEVYSKGTVTKYTWGDPAFPPSPSFITQYQIITKLLNTLTFN